jgi:hypothetical protein
MALTAPKKVPKPGLYYHYKHDPGISVDHYAYEVLSVGFHTEDDARPGEEHFVNYRPLYKDAPVYQQAQALGVPCHDSRPLEMWMGEVEKDGEMTPRFQRITDPVVIAELERIRDQMYP